MIPFPKAVCGIATASAAVAVFACVGVAIAQQDGFGGGYVGGQYRPAESSAYPSPGYAPGESNPEPSAAYGGAYSGAQGNPYVYRPVEPDPPPSAPDAGPAAPPPAWDETTPLSGSGMPGGDDWYATDGRTTEPYPGAAMEGINMPPPPVYPEARYTGSNYPAPGNPALNNHAINAGPMGGINPAMGQGPVQGPMMAPMQGGWSGAPMRFDSRRQPAYGAMQDMWNGVPSPAAPVQGVPQSPPVALSDADRQELRAIQRESRRVEHELVGRLMVERDALEELYERNPRPEPRSVGDIYARMFAVQREMIEHQVSISNRIDALYEQAAQAMEASPMVAEPGVSDPVVADPELSKATPAQSSAVPDDVPVPGALPPVLPAPESGNVPLFPEVNPESDAAGAAVDAAAESTR